MVYRFNNIKVNTENYQLTVGGKELPVEPQVFNLIIYLIENKERIVTRDELLEHIWQGRIVSDTSINNNIKTARKALGDDGTKQHVIKTIHSRGYQFIAELVQTNASQNDGNNTRTHSNRNIKIFSLFAAILSTAFILYSSQNPKSVTDVKNNKIYSIAVLPFLNSAADKATDYYGFAIADQVIGALNYLRNITVRPSSSIRQYTAMDYSPIQAGKELGVDFILTGHYTIGNFSDQYNHDEDISTDYEIRLNTELVDVNTHQIIWRGKPIITNYKNTFKIQDLVARQVVEHLKIEFASEKLNSIQANIPQSPLAYEYFLRSIAYPYETDGHRMAIGMLKQAIALDDQYAPAYIQLGNRIRRLAQYGLVETDPLPNTEQYYLKALSLNPELLEAMAHLSMLYTETNRIELAIELAKSMYQLNPNNANTHFTLGYIYRYAGLMDEAISEMEKAVALDPKNIKFRSLIGTYSATGQYQKALEMTYQYDPSPFTYGWQALMLNRMGQTEQAIELFDYLITNHPNSLWSNVAIIHRSSILGTIEEGLQAIDVLVNTEVTDGETIYYTAAYYGLLGDKKRSLQLLRKAVEAGYFNHLNIASNDYLNPIKSSQEFQLILDLAKSKHTAFRHIVFPEG